MKCLLEGKFGELDIKSTRADVYSHHLHENMMGFILKECSHELDDFFKKRGFDKGKLVITTFYTASPKCPHCNQDLPGMGLIGGERKELNKFEYDGVTIISAWRGGLDLDVGWEVKVHYETLKVLYMDGAKISIMKDYIRHENI